MLGLFASPQTARAARCGARRNPALGGLLPALFCLVLHAAVAPDAAAQTPTANADGSYTIPYDWAFKPAGLGEDDRFRLLVVTGDKYIGLPNSTTNYDNILRNDIRIHSSNTVIHPYYSLFKALISTPTVDARDHTSTTGTGMPIYWLNGAKVADSYTDFYDGSWAALRPGGHQAHWTRPPTLSGRAAARTAPGSTAMKWARAPRGSVLWYPLPTR